MLFSFGKLNSIFYSVTLKLVHSPTVVPQKLVSPPTSPELKTPEPRHKKKLHLPKMSKVQQSSRRKIAS